MKKLDQLAEPVSIGGPVALGLMGVAMTFWPPEGNLAKLTWIICFGIIGLIAAYAAFRSAKSTKQEMATLISGGENFCFFKINPEAAKDLTGPFQLYMEAVGGPVFDLNYWISPTSANRDSSDPAYRSVDTNTPHNPIIHHGTRAWYWALPVGEYFVDFDGRNGYWKQTLKIFVEDGKLCQAVRVESKDGKLLYEL